MYIFERTDSGALHFVNRAHFTEPHTVSVSYEQGLLHVRADFKDAPEVRLTFGPPADGSPPQPGRLLNTLKFDHAAVAFLRDVVGPSALDYLPEPLLAECVWLTLAGQPTAPRYPLHPRELSGRRLRVQHEQFTFSRPPMPGRVYDVLSVFGLRADRVTRRVLYFLPPGELHPPATYADCTEAQTFVADDEAARLFTLINLAPPEAPCAST